MPNAAPNKNSEKHKKFKKNALISFNSRCFLKKKRLLSPRKRLYLLFFGAGVNCSQNTQPGWFCHKFSQYQELQSEYSIT